MINSHFGRFSPNGNKAGQRLVADATVGGVQFAAFDVGTAAIAWSTEAAECRVTFDGVAPALSPANGTILAAGTSGTWSVKTAAAAKFIRTTSTSAVIQAYQFKEP